MVLYSILVDLSPALYCLPKPLFLYGSMVLLSTLELSSYNVTVVIMLGYDWWLCMVINISVHYYTVDPRLPNTSDTHPILDVM